MNESDKKVFFNMKKKKPHEVKIRGNFSFNSLPEDMRNSIKKRLAEKDEVMARGFNGELPGLKIDGKQVTKDNINEFEIKPTLKPSKDEKSTEEAIEQIEEKKETIQAETKYSKKELEELSFKELKKIGKKFGTTDRSKSNLIKEILKLQN